MQPKFNIPVYHNTNDQRIIAWVNRNYRTHELTKQNNEHSKQQELDIRHGAGATRCDIGEITRKHSEKPWLYSDLLTNNRVSFWRRHKEIIIACACVFSAVYGGALIYELSVTLTKG